MCRVLTFVFGILFIVYFVLLMVMVGIGYYYVNQDFLITACHINYKLFYGIGIGACLLTLLVIPAILDASKNPFSIFLGIPVMFLYPILVIIFSVSSNVQKCLGYYNSAWNDSETTRAIQITRECCGWSNCYDRGLENCPMHFICGCQNDVNSYMTPRFSQMLDFAIVTLCVGVASLIWCYVAMLIGDHDDLTFVYDI